VNRRWVDGMAIKQEEINFIRMLTRMLSLDEPVADGPVEVA